MNPVPPTETDERLFAGIFAAQGFSFRGGAVANLENAPMGKGHGNDGRPFDIETACYKKPIYAEYDKARANGTRLKLVLKAGVKTMKSFALEVCAGEHVCNGSGDVALYFGTENAAESTATTRILDFFKGNDQGGGIPRFRRKMETIRSRFDDAMGAIKFPDKTLFILAANLGNCQQKNLAMVGLEDAFVTGTSGMIKEMIARTTQYQKEAIVFLESQGGEKGFDFDREYEDTDQRELHVNCPCCGAQHIFNWKVFDEGHMTRGEGFAARPPLNVPESERAVWIEENSKKLAGKVAGFKRGDDEIIKGADGSYNEAAILRETHFECFHCGGLWRDDGEFGPTRIALDQAAGKLENHVPSRLDALPGNVGFNIPQWINRRLPWGQMMLDKLKAQKVAAELGNFMDLKIWWQKVAARTWDNEINAKVAEKPGASQYDLDPSKKFPGEKVRISATDIQFKLTHMVYLAVAVGDGTPPWVLHYEWVKPPSGMTDHQAAEWCKTRVRELDKKFGIQQQNSMKDSAHEPGLVRDWAAEDAVWARPAIGKKPVWFAYGLLMGDDRMSYKWAHPGRKDTWERFKQYQWHKIPCIKDGKRVLVDVHHRLWSNPSIKEIAERWRDGEGAPKLQIHSQWLTDNSPDGLWKQLMSERKIPWKGHPGKLHYNNENRPNHAWDCWCMIVLRMDELGYLNSFGAPPEDTDGD